MSAILERLHNNRTEDLYLNASASGSEGGKTLWAFDHDSATMLAAELTIDAG